MKRAIARAIASIATLASLLISGTAAAQSPGPPRIDGGGSLQVGGEAERYLRVLQVAGLAPSQPWTIRPLAPLQPTGDHPWRERWSVDSVSPGMQWRWLRPSARMAFNTTFPYQVITGPAWAGRGVTAQLDGGVIASWGRFRAQIQPTVFATQNADFTPAPNGLQGDEKLRDARFPGRIDAPQRFGTSTYARFDGGNSTLSVDLAPLLLGVSTAAQSWGPAREFPLVLSANSGGFAHAFLATNRPLDLWIAKLNLRVIAGTLGSSPVAKTMPNPKRWATGLAFALLPRGVDGLELGASRFVSEFSPSGIPTFESLRRLVARGLRASLHEGGDNRADENQMASAWFRWAIPRARTEFYGEYYREDYALDLRWFLQYPDDLATYTLGLQHVGFRGGGRLRAYRLEVVNGEIASSNKRQRAIFSPDGRTTLDDPIPPYRHSRVQYGHTNRGLFLGSPEAYGGAAWRVGIDDYDSKGRSSLTIERLLRFDWLPGTPPGVRPSPDVILSTRAERIRFVGDREFGITLIPMINLNRNLKPGDDKLNLSAAVSFRGFR